MSGQTFSRVNTAFCCTPASAPGLATRWGLRLAWGLGLALAGCSQGDSGAAGAGWVADKGAAFEASDCQARLLDGSPALAVLFTQPLDRKQNLAEQIRVTDLGPAPGGGDGESGRASPGGPPPAVAPGSAAPDGKLLRGQWVVSDNPRIAYFPYIQPQRRLRIDVPATLRSGDGVTLRAAKACEVASEAMAPSFYFASRGVVLPAGQNGGLPVVTVNTPQVDVQFLKVEGAALPAFLERVAGVQRARTAPTERTATDTDAGDETEAGDEGDNWAGGDWGWGNRRLKGAVGGWELDELRQTTRSVYLGRFNTTATANKRQVSFIPVEGIAELREPGVYVAVMGQPGRFAADYQVTYFYVSDVGVQLRRYSQGLDAFATSLRTGQALGDVRFELLDDTARPLGQAQTDRDGHAHFDTLPAKAALLVARRGEGARAGKSEMSVIVLREPGLDLSEFDTGGHPSRRLKLFAYAGRDLYRPGEAFDLSVLVRDADGKPLTPQPLTATLKRPDGRSVSTHTWPASAQQPGYVQQRIRLPADAATGAWLLELRGDPGAKRPDTVWKFQVEEFLPERMKLSLTTAKAVLQAGDSLDVRVQGDHLFGSPAAGNRLLVSAFAERQRMALPQQWPGFIFGDFADDSVRERQSLGEQTLDSSGAAQTVVPVPSGAKSVMRVRGSFSLLESGGRPVVRSIERSVWPAAKLLAVRPLFDREVAPENSQAAFELVRVDSAGKPQPLARAPLRLVREERQYHWRFVDGRGWESGYTETEELVETGSVALGAQRTPLSLPVRWGRYRLEVDDPETRQTLRYRFYAGWGAQDAEAMGNRPDRVQLQLARAPLKAGETAELRITPPHDGSALVVVEGDELLWRQRVEVKASGTTVSIPVAPGWARHDLYIGVTAFRPGSQGDRVTPSRAVGLVHLPLARQDRQIKLSLSAPARVQPESMLRVKVKAEGLAGQRAQVTLSAVDVGILNISRYATPDAFDFFYGKHRYAPDLLDLYGKLIEKMEGNLAKLAYGGDTKMRDSQSLPKKVKLVDLFSGPVALNEQGEAEISLPVPDFNGTLRLMAVAAGGDHFGKAEAEVVSAAPVVAELAMPRFISPGDAATIAVDVSNLSGAAQSLKVTLEGADPVRVLGGEKTLQLAHQQRRTLRFGVEATDAYGLGRLRLQVRSVGVEAGAKPAGPAIQISREAVLQVQPPIAAEREVRRLRLEPGGTLKFEPAWVERYYKGSATLNVSLSNRPPLNVKRLVQGLLDYPYGCAEQTTSAAYPHVFIDEATARAQGLPPRTREQRAQFVEGAVSRLAGMQKHNGGFTLWGDGPYETWLSSYIYGFLQDARAQGFAVPEPALQSAQGWLLQELQQAPNRFPSLPSALRSEAAGAATPPEVSWRDYELVRDSHKRLAELAYVGYMLARDQKAPLAMLRYLHDQVRSRARSPLPLIHLGLALRLMGDEPRAKVALDEAMARPYGIQLRYPGGWAQEWLGDYGSQVRDMALSYTLLKRHKATHPQLENMLFDLADRLGERQYLSTQERLALFLAAREVGATDTQAEWTAVLAGLPAGEGGGPITSTTTAQRSLPVAAVAKGGLSLGSQASTPLFVEVEAEGFPLKAPAPKADVIELQREWFDSSGQPWGSRPLKVGDMLIVKLSARSKRHIPDALLIDRVPAGFEIENMNLSQGPQMAEFTVGNVNIGSAMQDARIKHREYRDDRYVAAVRLERGADWLHVFYMVRVVSPGRFVVPAPYAEDMYRAELRAIGPPSPAITISDPFAPRHDAEPEPPATAASGA